MSAQTEATESHYFFDDAEHRFNRLLAQFVEFLADIGLQPDAPFSPWRWRPGPAPVGSGWGSRSATVLGWAFSTAAYTVPPLPCRLRSVPPLARCADDVDLHACDAVAGAGGAFAAGWVSFELRTAADPTGSGRGQAVNFGIGESVRRRTHLAFHGLTP